jgi:hypothetical protein
MGSLWLTDVQAHPTAFVDGTGVPLDEFPLLAPALCGRVSRAYACVAARWPPRTAHRFTVYQNRLYCQKAPLGPCSAPHPLLSATAGGRLQDKQLAEATRPPFPAGTGCCRLWASGRSPCPR